MAFGLLLGLRVLIAERFLFLIAMELARWRKRPGVLPLQFLVQMPEKYVRNPSC